MARLRSPWTRAFLIWTTVMALAAVVLAFVAIAGFLRAAGICWFQAGPCAQAGDANDVLLRFAAVGVPAVWLVGMLAGAAAYAWQHRGR
jgi:hypothetical protein